MVTFMERVGVLAVCALGLWSSGCGSSRDPLSDAAVAGGAGGSGASGGGGSAGSTGGAGGTGGAVKGDAAAGTGGGGRPADAGASCDGGCGQSRACCQGRCVNTANDPFNCGQCGVTCSGATPFCSGSCQVAPCARGACPGGQCCGTECCGTGQICCEEQGPVSRLPVCHTPTAAAPSCPQGCAPLCRSDRDQKKNITPADIDAVLERIRRLPLATWTYREEPDSVRHMGPMAQDFRAAFGLGDDDRHYHAVDAHGVALAAIQSLERMAAEQRRRIDALEAQNRKLERKIRALETKRRRD